MSTFFRVGSAEASRAAFGKVEMINPVKLKKHPNVEGKCYRPLVSAKQSNFKQTSLFGSSPWAVSTFYCISQVSRRWSHTDLKYPDFTDYRLESTKDPTKRAIETEDARRAVPYLAYGVGGMIGLYVAKYTIRTIVEYKSAPSDMLALASIEVNLDDIAEGKSCTFLWRGKPVFVRHRSPEQIEKERAVDVQQLRHPQTDQERTKKDEWLVVIGICTHLGCVPLANSGDFGGYYCPCHGSHYDLSGRVRKGPAPLNLEVPDFYEFKENKLIVGK